MKQIFVTKPSLPRLEEFQTSLARIWKSEYITNNGEFHKELEAKLAAYLGVKYVSLFSNGTLALITALQALGIKGDVITTPYSFVATTNSLLWNGVKPVFADVNSNNCNIDVEAIESAITSETTALMPVHVYGVPCEMEKIESIAKKYNLKVIYDAAHAFGVQHNGQSVLNYGDLSILSFHATKVFNTIEGGAIISHTKEMKQKIDNLKNFGIIDELTVVDAGINAKMNEVQAAYGLLNLKHVDEEILKRKKCHDLYVELLKDVAGVDFLDISEVKGYNYGYYPIFIKDDYALGRNDLYDLLMENGIYSRRYFYPLISDFPIYSNIESANRSNLKNAAVLTESVLCLPMYAELEEEDIIAITNLIKNPIK